MVKVYVPTETWAPCCPVSHWDGARRRAELLQGVIPISTKEIIKYLLSKFTNETAFLSSLVHKKLPNFVQEKKIKLRNINQSSVGPDVYFFFFFGCAGSLWCAQAELPQGLRDLTSSTRDQTHVPCNGKWSTAGPPRSPWTWCLVLIITEKTPQHSADGSKSKQEISFIYKHYLQYLILNMEIKSTKM